jgi:hypothetical protein
MIRLAIFLLVISNFAPAKPVEKVQKQTVNQRVYIRLPLKHRNLVPPETVGYPKDFPFPVSKEVLTFQCPKCGLKMSTHGLYHHLPHCPKKNCDSCPMPEID